MKRTPAVVALAILLAICGNDSFHAVGVDEKIRQMLMQKGIEGKLPLIIWEAREVKANAWGHPQQTKVAMSEPKVDKGVIALLMVYKENVSVVLANINFPDEKSDWLGKNHHEVHFRVEYYEDRVDPVEKSFPAYRGSRFTSNLVFENEVNLFVFDAIKAGAEDISVNIADRNRGELIFKWSTLLVDQALEDAEIWEEGEMCRDNPHCSQDVENEPSGNP